MRISILIDECRWRQLRDVAEIHRNGGRASVSRIIREAVDRILAEANSEAGARSTSSDVRNLQAN